MILSLATWRISSLFVREHGAWGIFTRMREAVGIRHDDDHKPSVIPDTMLAGLLACVWCVSVWIGAAVALAYYVAPQWTVGMSLPLALSASAILTDRAIR